MQSRYGRAPYGLGVKHSLAVLALLGAVVLPAAPAAAACDVSVGFPTFSPASHTVARGGSVTWCWAEGGHSVTGSFADSGVRTKDSTFAHTFASAGTFSYACSVHGSMTGQIVEQQASTSPTAAPSKSPTPKQTTKAPTPTPARTTTAPTTRAQPSTTPAVIVTSAAPSATPSAIVTSAAPTAPASSTAPVLTSTPAASQAPLDIDPAPAKPKTGLAIALGLVVAAGAFGGAGWLLLRGSAG